MAKNNTQTNSQNMDLLEANSYPTSTSSKSGVDKYYDAKGGRSTTSSKSTPGVAGTGYWSNSGWVQGGNSANDPSYGNLTAQGKTYGSVADDPLMFDTPAYQRLTGQTTPTLTDEELKKTEDTIQGFKDYSASVSSSDGISDMISAYKKQIAQQRKQIAETKKQLKDTSNFYYNQQELQSDILDQQKGGPAATGGDQTTTDENGDPLVPDALTNTYNAQQQFLTEQVPIINQQYQLIQDSMIQYGETLEDEYQALTNQIADTFDQRRQQQIQSNKATMGGLDVMGMRSGRSRYAPELQGALVSEQESANLTKLRNIDTEERGARLEALQAWNKSNYELFISRMESMNDWQDQKRSLIGEIYKNALDYNNELQEAQQEKRLQEQAEFNKSLDLASLYGPTILNQMTGNPEEDDAMLNAYAAEVGIPPEMLRGVVQSAVYEERQAAKERAFKNASGNKADIIDLGSAFEMGLPTSIVGMTETDIAADFSSPIPPDWFMTEVKLIQGTPDVNIDQAMPFWNQYREEKKTEFGMSDDGFNSRYDEESFRTNQAGVDEVISSGSNTTTTEDNDGGWWDSFKRIWNTDPEPEKNSGGSGVDMSSI